MALFLRMTNSNNWHPQRDCQPGSPQKDSSRLTLGKHRVEGAETHLLSVPSSYLWSYSWPCGAVKDTKRMRVGTLCHSPLSRQDEDIHQSQINAFRDWIHYKHSLQSVSHFCYSLKMDKLGLPWWPSDWDSMLPAEGTQVWSRIRELDPTIPHVATRPGTVK